jgi:hypothetical protein
MALKPVSPKHVPSRKILTPFSSHKNCMESPIALGQLQIVMPHALAAYVPFYLKCSWQTHGIWRESLWFRDILQTLFTPLDSHTTEYSLLVHKNT